MHFADNIMVAAISRDTNFQRLVGVMYHAVGIPEFDGDVGQSYVQRCNFWMLGSSQNGQEQESTLGNQPRFGVTLQGEEVDAEADIAPRCFSRVQTQNALAESTYERGDTTYKRINSRTKTKGARARDNNAEAKTSARPRYLILRLL